MNCPESGRCFGGLTGSLVTPRNVVYMRMHWGPPGKAVAISTSRPRFSAILGQAHGSELVWGLRSPPGRLLSVCVFPPSFLPHSRREHAGAEQFRCSGTGRMMMRMEPRLRGWGAYGEHPPIRAGCLEAHCSGNWERGRNGRATMAAERSVRPGIYHAATAGSVRCVEVGRTRAPARVSEGGRRCATLGIRGGLRPGMLTKLGFESSSQLRLWPPHQPQVSQHCRRPGCILAERVRHGPHAVVGACWQISKPEGGKWGTATVTDCDRHWQILCVQASPQRS